MMPRLLSLAALIAAAWSQAATAQQYLPQADLATCLTRSAAQCEQLGCQPGTTYWWACQKLTDGTAAVTVDPTRPEFDAVHPRGPGLTSGERAALLARAAMSTKLPDILSSAMFLSRLTTAQRNAITTFANNHPNTAFANRWSAIQGGADVDLSLAAVQTFIQALRSNNIATDSDVTALTAPQSTP